MHVTPISVGLKAGRSVWPLGRNEAQAYGKRRKHDACQQQRTPLFRLPFAQGPVDCPCRRPGKPDA